MKSKITNIILIILIAFVSTFALAKTVQQTRTQRALTQAQNDLSEALGTIEIADGVWARLAMSERHLQRSYEDLLGDNSLLSDEIDRKNEEVRALMQTASALREQISFQGTGEVTIVESCPDNPKTPEDESQTIPNIRVEFNIDRLGFNLNGYTQTNPSNVNISLSQIDPFIIDLVLTQNDDGVWRALISEQQQRLTFDVGTLAVNAQASSIRWHERIGIGSSITAASDGFGISPHLSLRLGSRGAWSVWGGPYFERESRGATLGFSVYPTTRRRR